MAFTNVRGTGVGVDLREFSEFAALLKEEAPALAKSLRARMLGIAEEVAEEARGNASEYSDSIPSTIVAKATAKLQMSVQAGGPDIPLARLFELGNKGKRGGGGSFRHPVFGNKNVWVAQPMHPYLLPAVQAKDAHIDAAAVAAMDDVIGKLTNA